MALSHFGTEIPVPVDEVTDFADIRMIVVALNRSSNFSSHEHMKWGHINHPIIVFADDVFRSASAVLHKIRTTIYRTLDG